MLRNFVFSKTTVVKTPLKSGEDENGRVSNTFFWENTATNVKHIDFFLFSTRRLRPMADRDKTAFIKITRDEMS